MLNVVGLAHAGVFHGSTHQHLLVMWCSDDAGAVCSGRHTPLHPTSSTGHPVDSGGHWQQCSHARERARQVVQVQAGYYHALLACSGHNKAQQVVHIKKLGLFYAHHIRTCCQGQHLWRIQCFYSVCMLSVAVVAADGIATVASVQCVHEAHHMPAFASTCTDAPQQFRALPAEHASHDEFKTTSWAVLLFCRHPGSEWCSCFAYMSHQSCLCSGTGAGPRHVDPVALKAHAPA